MSNNISLAANLKGTNKLNKNKWTWLKIFQSLELRGNEKPPLFFRKKEKISAFGVQLMTNPIHSHKRLKSSKKYGVEGLPIRREALSYKRCAKGKWNNLSVLKKCTGAVPTTLKI